MHQRKCCKLIGVVMMSIIITTIIITTIITIIMRPPRLIGDIMVRHRRQSGTITIIITMMVA